MFFRFQAVRHTSPIVNRSAREVAFLWKALTANDDLTSTMDDFSSRLSASAAWFTAPATAGVPVHENRKSVRSSPGRIRRDQWNGVLRRQRFRTQTGRKAPGFRRLMHRIFCHVPFRRTDYAGKGKTNHRLNDKSGSPWYSVTERQGRTTSLITKPAREPASGRAEVFLPDEGAYSSACPGKRRNFPTGARLINQNPLQAVKHPFPPRPQPFRKEARSPVG